jgi:hypothetical protein
MPNFLMEKDEQMWPSSFADQTCPSPAFDVRIRTVASARTARFLEAKETLTELFLK